MYCAIAKVSTRLSASLLATVNNRPGLIVNNRVYSMAASAQKFQLQDVQGDLFSCPPTDGLVHCVSQDLRMGKGIAVIFKNKFGGVEDLKKQKKKVGDVAVLKRDGRFVYYLITKPHYYDKPTYETLKASLNAMKAHCQQNKVYNLSMPRIGCGLDKLEWSKVSNLLKEVFSDSNITVTVYSV